MASMLPEPARDDVFSVFGLTGTLLLWAVLAVSVIHIASVEPARTPRRDTARDEGFDDPPPALLRPGALRRAASDLPDHKSMLAYLSAALDPADAGAVSGMPETADRATALALAQILANWEAPTVHALSPARLGELYLFERLIRARADEAGALAQFFQRPDLVLDIRDQIGAIAARRRAFDAQQGAFEATLAAWKTQARVPRPAALLMALQALDHPDSDLWHRVVLGHDPRDAAQREAALWCVRQPSCDRATVACYMAFLGADGHLEAAARRGDSLWLAGVLAVIEGWNAGRYADHDIGLVPSDAVTEAGPILAAALDNLSEITGAPRWPDPRGMFTDYAGRSPRPRPAWCLRTGRLTAAPDPADYFDTDRAASAA